MSNQKPGSRRETEKLFATRMVEFVRALQLVSDSLQRIREGQTRHLLTLSGQLRALLTERSRNAKPLLLDIAKELRQELRIYVMPGVKDSALPLRDGLVLHVAGFPITSQRQFAAQVEVSFPEVLNREVLFFKGNNYTAKTVIEWYANKAGGAHYSTRLPEDFAALVSIDLFNLQPQAQILVQFGEATLTAGRQLLKRFVDVEIHASVVVPPQEPNNIADVNYLFDAQYQNSPMRLSLVLNKRLMPSFFARGLQNLWLRVDSDRLIDWSKPRHLYAALRIEDDLSTALELAVDGVRVGRGRIDEPLFVLADPLNYEWFHNRSVDGKPQLFSFGVGEFVMFNRECSPVDAANNFVYFGKKMRDPDLTFLVYSPEAYGHSPKGTKDLKLAGSVQRDSASTILRGN